MSSTNEPRESSLPTQHVPNIPSTPPILTIRTTPPQMADESDFKSEPFTPQPSRTHQPTPSRVNTAEAEGPHSARESQPNADEEAEAEDAAEEEDSGPADKIASFDWDDLLQRYHQAMNGCHDQEDGLMQEWESLMNVLLHVGAFPPHY